MIFLYIFGYFLLKIFKYPDNIKAEGQTKWTVELTFMKPIEVFSLAKFTLVKLIEIRRLRKLLFRVFTPLDAYVKKI